MKTTAPIPVRKSSANALKQRSRVVVCHFVCAELKAEMESTSKQASRALNAN